MGVKLKIVCFRKPGSEKFSIQIVPFTIEIYNQDWKKTYSGYNFLENFLNFQFLALFQSWRRFWQYSYLIMVLNYFEFFAYSRTLAQVQNKNGLTRSCFLKELKIFLFWIFWNFDKIMFSQDMQICINLKIIFVKFEAF